MARVQPVLTETEKALVDQMAQLTRTKRTEVMKNAIAVYHWFVRQAITGARSSLASPRARRSRSRPRSSRHWRARVTSSARRSSECSRSGWRSRPIPARPHGFARDSRAASTASRPRCPESGARTSHRPSSGICSSESSSARSTHDSSNCWPGGSTPSRSCPRAVVQALLAHDGLWGRRARQDVSSSRPEPERNVGPLNGTESDPLRLVSAGPQGPAPPLARSMSERKQASASTGTDVKRKR